MATLLLRRFLLAASCLGVGGGAAAQEPPAGSAILAGRDPDAFGSLPRTLQDDTRQVFSVTGRWETREWNFALASVALILVTGLTLDRPVDKAMLTSSPSSPWGRAARFVSPLGSTPGVLAAVGIYIAGAAFRSPGIRATGTDAMVAIAIAEIAIVLPLKLLVGRSRPNAGEGTHAFNPFSGDVSFPSGHTTVSFALASVISGHAQRPWVSWTAYGVAGLVGLARVQERSHFFSDVVAGGLIGTFVGRTVVSRNQTLRDPGGSRVVVTLTPALLDGGLGLCLTARF